MAKKYMSQSVPILPEKEDLPTVISGEVPPAPQQPVATRTIVPPRCWRCVYYQPTNETHGECRRRAPSAPSPGTALFAPVRGEADWCGEFENNKDAVKGTK